MKTTLTLILTLAIPALCPAASDKADNLLDNEGFESPSIGASTESDTTPSNWSTSSTVNGGGKFGLSTAFVRTGKQSARVTAQGVLESHQGLYQTLSVTPGATYTFSVYVRNDKAQPISGSACGQILIEWKDASDVSVERVGGQTWNSSLFSAHWVRFEAKGKAPANAAKAEFVIIEFDGKGPVMGGSFLLDDAVVTMQP